MGCTACTETQCLYKGALYLHFTVTDTVPHTQAHLKIKFPVFYKSAEGRGRDFLQPYFPMKTKITFINSMIYALFFEETAQLATKTKAKNGN